MNKINRFAIPIFVVLIIFAAFVAYGVGSFVDEMYFRMRYGEVPNELVREVGDDLGVKIKEAFGNEWEDGRISINFENKYPKKGWLVKDYRFVYSVRIEFKARKDNPIEVAGSKVSLKKGDFAYLKAELVFERLRNKWVYQFSAPWAWVAWHPADSETAVAQYGLAGVEQFGIMNLAKVWQMPYSSPKPQEKKSVPPERHALNVSEQSMSPGSRSTVVANKAKVEVDYTSGVAKVYLNGELIWGGHGSSIKVSNGKDVVIRIDGKQVWPK